MFIREYTISQLDKDTVNNFVGDRKERSNEIRIQTLTYIPYVKNNKLLCVANVIGKTSNYITKISFSNVNFEGDVIITTSSNEDQNLEPISLNNADVEVKCNCLDFFQRLSSYNKNVNALYGKDTPNYTGSTTPENKKKGNPNNSPGICKHVYALLDHLKSEGLVIK